MIFKVKSQISSLAASLRRLEEFITNWIEYGKDQPPVLYNGSNVYLIELSETASDIGHKLIYLNIEYFLGDLNDDSVNEEIINRVENTIQRINLLISSFSKDHKNNILDSTFVATFYTIIEFIEDNIIKNLPRQEPSFKEPIDDKAFSSKIRMDDRFYGPAIDKNPILAEIQDEQLHIINEEKDRLKEQLQALQNKVESHRRLYNEMQEFIDAEKDVRKVREETRILKEKVEENINNILSNEEKSAEILSECKNNRVMITAIGLSAAFVERAKKSSISMYCWIAGLVIILLVGACVNSNLFDKLSKSITPSTMVEGAATDSTPAESTTLPVKLEWGVILINIVILILYSAVPIWLAWIATKQISQHFKLTEDYRFKATIATVYEGYQSEAEKFKDDEIAARLFKSVLSRFDEPPLRFMDKGDHGSPMHELLDGSPEVIKTILETALKTTKDKSEK